jgi:hypothetical protein
MKLYIVVFICIVVGATMCASGKDPEEFLDTVRHTM